MTVERTRLDGAFAQVPKIVRESYVTLDDIDGLRKNKGSKKNRIQIVERCNRYCHAADQPETKLKARLIGGALRKQYGDSEADKIMDFARLYRKCVPRHLWAESWHTAKEKPRGESAMVESRTSAPLVVVPPYLAALVGLQAYLLRFVDINRQLHEIREHLGNLDRQLLNRPTNTQVRTLYVNWSQGLMAQHREEWVPRISRLEGMAVDGRAAASILEDNFYRRSAEMLDRLADHRDTEHRSRHLPNPLRPIAVLASRLRLAVRVLMRGQEHPFQ